MMINEIAEKFAEHYNCAQIVVSIFSEKLNLKRDIALRLATGFGAGMARKQEVCGAVCGGIMVLGLRHGRGEKEGREVTEKTYIQVRELMAHFEREHGSCMCRTLLEDCELTTPEGQKTYRESGFLKSVCIPCVETVINFLGKKI
ncbi:MAG: C-GCAxxG-C-C family protein [Thermodesulfobacteriota bacterium]